MCYYRDDSSFCTVGIILLTTVDADGTVTTSQQGVALSDEKEKISSVLNTGKDEFLFTVFGSFLYSTLGIYYGLIMKDID